MKNDRVRDAARVVAEIARAGWDGAKPHVAEAVAAAILAGAAVAAAKAKDGISK